MLSHKGAMPVSTAKTAYGVLSDIVKLSLEEPLRMDMSEWCKLKASESANYPSKRLYPECGTVGCIGGWAETLLGLRYGDASDALGLNVDQANELFTPPGWGSMTGQTMNHARWVARHISRFQKKYAKQLKAHKVTTCQP